MHEKINASIEKDYNYPNLARVNMYETLWIRVP